MWNDGWTHGGMMGWADGGWHWLLSFHGLLSAIFLAVIVFALVGIVRDLRRRDDKSPAETTLATRSISWCWRSPSGAWPSSRCLAGVSRAFTSGQF